MSGSTREGLKYNQFSPQILCLQVSVLIIHWHCFQVSNARAQLAKKINLHQRNSQLLSEEISGIC